MTFLAMFHLLTLQSSQAVTVNEVLAHHIETCLSQVHNTVCEYPAPEYRGEDLIIATSLRWQNPVNLTLASQKNIIFEPGLTLHSLGGGSLTLKAGLAPHSHKENDPPTGTVIFQGEDYPHIIMEGGGHVDVYYNPSPITTAEHTVSASQSHKYQNSQAFAWSQRISLEAPWQFVAYMMVNHIRDLQDINRALHENYALAHDIDAQETRTWDKGKGFRPLRKVRRDGEVRPFSGHFDGNGFTIHSLYINRPGEDNVGLFGITASSSFAPNRIKNLAIHNATIIGSHYVGALAGDAQFTSFDNITIAASSIKGHAVVGSLVGTGNDMHADNIDISSDTVAEADEYDGGLFGTLHCTKKVSGEQPCAMINLKKNPNAAAPKEETLPAASNGWWTSTVDLLGVYGWLSSHLLLDYWQKLDGLQSQAQLGQDQCLDGVQVCQAGLCASCPDLIGDPSSVRNWTLRGLATIGRITSHALSAAFTGLLYGAALGAAGGTASWVSDKYWSMGRDLASAKVRETELRNILQNLDKHGEHINKLIETLHASESDITRLQELISYATSITEKDTLVKALQDSSPYISLLEQIKEALHESHTGIDSLRDTLIPQRTYPDTLEMTYYTWLYSSIFPSVYFYSNYDSLFRSLFPHIIHVSRQWYTTFHPSTMLGGAALVVILDAGISSYIKHRLDYGPPSDPIRTFTHHLKVGILSGALKGFFTGATLEAMRHTLAGIIGRGSEEWINTALMWSFALSIVKSFLTSAYLFSRAPHLHTD